MEEIRGGEESTRQCRQAILHSKEDKKSKEKEKDGKRAGKAYFTWVLYASLYEALYEIENKYFDHGKNCEALNREELDAVVAELIEGSKFGKACWEYLIFLWNAVNSKWPMAIDTPMPANVETMFYVREKPWHGLGTEVKEAPISADALIYAGLDWEVVQKDVYTGDGRRISGYKANLRNTDNATHADPIRRTKNYEENLFLRTVEGNPMIDKAYKMVLAAA